MSIFKSEKIIPIGLPDLSSIATELAEHFRQRGYEVECNRADDGGEWEVGITRGGVFKAAVGLKSALKVRIGAHPGGTIVRAGAGVFGKQAVPTAISMFVAWPVLLTQVWGLIREAGLDNEAVRVVEVSLKRAQRLGGAFTGDSSPSPASGVPGATATEASENTIQTGSVGRADSAGTSAAQGMFCSACGTHIGATANFCPSCGQALQAS